MVTKCEIFARNGISWWSIYAWECKSFLSKLNSVLMQIILWKDFFPGINPAIGDQPAILYPFYYHNQLICVCYGILVDGGCGLGQSAIHNKDAQNFSWSNKGQGCSQSNNTFIIVSVDGAFCWTLCTLCTPWANQEQMRRTMSFPIRRK